MKRVKFSEQYSLLSSPKDIVWNYISTPKGLNQWFASEVNIIPGGFNFKWDGQEQRSAKIIDIQPEEKIRLQWENSLPDEYWEMEIDQAEVTGETILTVTDFSNSDEMEDDILLWQTQIDELKHLLGC